MSNQDRILSDEELRDYIYLQVDLAKRRDGHSLDDNTVGESTDNLLNLINTQKRLYAESVIGQDEERPSLKDATHMTQALEVKWRNELRAEQRARIK